MVENISKKVLKSERNLERRPTPSKDPSDEALPIRVVSTYGSDTDLVKTVKKYEDELKKTRSFNDLSKLVDNSTPEQPKQGKQLFQFVKKTGSNLKSSLVKVKHLALGNKHGQTKPCKQKNCATCCKSVNSSMKLNVNGESIKPAPGPRYMYYVQHCIPRSL